MRIKRVCVGVCHCAFAVRPKNALAWNEKGTERGAKVRGACHGRVCVTGNWRIFRGRQSDREARVTQTHAYTHTDNAYTHNTRPHIIYTLTKYTPTLAHTRMHN